MSDRTILYAPWRKEYYTSSSKENSKNSKTCVFCNPKKSEIIVSTKTCFVQANKYPYAAGHMLVLPKRHINNITDLTSKERSDIFNLLDLCAYALNIYIKPEGYNIGCSVGRVAGESIEHLHFHILPRFQGDIGWGVFAKFSVLSISPKELTKDIKEIIKKNKLKQKFDIF
jgi:ATP adenylyltransferase